MLAHDLATWLLAGPNEKVEFELAHSLFSFEELAGDYGKEAARDLDVEGSLFDDVMDIYLHLPFGPAIRVKIGSNECVTEDLGKEPMEVLDGPIPPTAEHVESVQDFIQRHPEWGCRHARYGDTLRCAEMSCSNYVEKHR